MAAAYDNYDYPSYWIGREYEHESEIIALRNFLQKIPKINRILEIGCGFGRLTPYYRFRARRIVLTDPSAKLLSLARKRLVSSKKSKNHVTFVQTSAESLSKKFKKESFDLVIMVRVAHHLQDLDQAFLTIKRLLPRGGYLIFEFPNKLHLKAVILNTIKGNFTFPLDILPADKRSRKSLRNNCLPFFNYHPEIIYYKLKSYGFKLVEKRSVSNIRMPFIKKHLSLESILTLEKILQKPLGKVNFGPSIFLLMKKI